LNENDHLQELRGNDNTTSIQDYQVQYVASY